MSMLNQKKKKRLKMWSYKKQLFITYEQNGRKMVRGINKGFKMREGEEVIIKE